jgi:hypothetical protein
MNQITIHVAGNLFAPQLATLAAGITKALPGPADYNAAVRYHSGGIAGLRPDEVPAILQPGERIRTAFTKVTAEGLHLPADSDRTDHFAVIDHSTGLMWSVESLGDPSDENDGITQEHCIERCKQLRLLGYDDWRLPTRTELADLVDDTRHEPAIDVSLFPHVKPRWHWTSTPAAWSSASAWGVGFDNGVVGSNPRNSDGFALAVRRASQ